MFARSLSVRLKRNKVAEFMRLFDEQATPLLRQKDGFLHVLTLVSPGGHDVLAISIWSGKEKAEAYSQSGYAEVLQTLRPVLDGTPEVRGFEVCSATFLNASFANAGLATASVVAGE
jgi:quinol monooxygenase YgiN